MRTLLTLPLLLAVSGCHFIQGSGRLQTESRNFASFHAVELRGIADVTMVSGPGSISVTADENLLQYVAIEVKNDTLVLEEKDPVTGASELLATSHGIKVQVSTPVAPADARVSGTGSFTWADASPLTVETLGLHVDGTGSIHAPVAVTNVNADISGTGSIDVSGSGSHGIIDLSGTGSLRAFALALATATAHVSGTGSAEVTVRDSLDAEVTGTGSVLYRGNQCINGPRVPGSA